MATKINYASCLYDGKDPSLKENPYCLTCGHHQSDDSRALAPCSGGCGMVHYCSHECQEKDLLKHQVICIEIQRCSELVHEEETKLRSLSGVAYTSDDDKPIDAFTTLAGRFWDVKETREYMKARRNLAEKLAIVAERVNTVQGWETVKMHYQEMMRLCQCDNLGLRFRFPFLLATLNHDDEAYAFCADWFHIDQDFWEFRLGGVRSEQHATSREGDYLFLQRDNYRYCDIFTQCPFARSTETRLFLLLAVAVIKMRLVAQYESYQQVMHTIFEETVEGKKLAQVAPIISDQLVGGDTGAYKAKMEPQREQLNHLLDSIDETNPTVLKALLKYHNPACKSSQKIAFVHSSSDPMDASIIIDDARRCMERIPGAMELLASRF